MPRHDNVAGNRGSRTAEADFCRGLTKNVGALLVIRGRPCRGGLGRAVRSASGPEDRKKGAYR